MIDDNEVADDCESFDDYCEDCSQLTDRQDYAGLMRRCRQRFERYPGDPDAVLDVADAYVQAGQFEQAIVFVRPYYEADPDSFDFQHCILAALAGNAVKHFFCPTAWRSGRSRSRQTSGAARIGPNSGESGYQNASQRCLAGMKNVG